VLITFSAGVARLEPGEAGESMVRRADEAMYEAKRQGRNRVLAA
jgi:diguanylate cyclase